MPLPAQQFNWRGTHIDIWSEYGPPQRRELEIHVTITGPVPDRLTVSFINRQNGNVQWQATETELVEGLNNIILSNQQAVQPSQFPYFLSIEVG